jgi:hypothetical protein
MVMIQLVREYIINEKFTDESDPIEDLGIGLIHKIKEWLEKHNVTNYTINKNLSIDVNDNLNLPGILHNNFPSYINFNHVHGNVNLVSCNLTSLKGCPKIIDGWFSCDRNKLTSLKYGPKKVQLTQNKSSNYECHYNKLTSLKGLPKLIPGNLWCQENAKVFTEIDVEEAKCIVNGRTRFC